MILIDYFSEQNRASFSIDIRMGEATGLGIHSDCIVVVIHVLENPCSEYKLIDPKGCMKKIIAENVLLKIIHSICSISSGREHPVPYDYFLKCPNK